MGLGSGSDAEGRRNGTNDRWRASCHEGETSENGGESDIVNVKEREMFSLKNSEGKDHSRPLHGRSSHCLSVDHRSPCFCCRARAPSHQHGQTSPSARGREFRQVSSCDRALLARVYHLPSHGGAFLPSSLPQNFVECPPGSLCFNR